MQIYLDNASTTPMYPEVIDKMVGIMKEEFGNPSSIHKNGRNSKAIIEQSRKTVAKIINSSISELFFTSSATEANNMILKNAVQDLGVNRIISSPTEHHCVLHTLDFLTEHTTCTVEYIKLDDQGRIDISDLENRLKSQNKKTLVSIMHGNNEIGTMADITLIGALCKQHDCLFHCDAVQTIGKHSIDVQKSNIHFLSGSAHKFHGPKGVGLVYINNDYMLSPFILGGAQERNMRAGTENVSGIAGLALALDISNTNKESNRAKILKLRDKLKDALSTIFDDIQFNGAQSEPFLAHVLSVSFPPTPKAELLVFNLDIAGISASSGSACSAGIEEDSHVLLSINHHPERKTIRFSFSHMNTEEEIDYVIEKLKSLTPLKQGIPDTIII